MHEVYALNHGRGAAILWHGWLPNGARAPPLPFYFRAQANNHNHTMTTTTKAPDEDIRGEDVVGELSGSPVRRTMDFDEFYYDPRNRSISQPHLRELRSSVEENNRLDQNPIVVNADGRVLDGQHRLEVARELNVPIYYQIDDTMGMEDVPRMNRAQKSWTTHDYLNFYAESGDEDYIKLRSFLERHDHLSLSFAAEVLGGGGRGNVLKRFRRGDFEVGDEERAENVAEFIRDFFVLGHEFTNKKSFCRAVERVSRSDVYDHDRMLRKAEKLGMQHQANTKDYMRQFERLFNHNRHERVQLF